MARTREGGSQPNGQTRPTASICRRDCGVSSSVVVGALDASLAEGFLKDL